MCRAVIIVGVGLLLALPAAQGARAAEDDWAAGAEQRIEQHRKADAVVRVADAAGRPIAGAEVTVEQTSHEFLFGCNIFLWADDQSAWREKGLAGDRQDKYRQRFAELFNYATLPFYWPGYERQAGKPRHEYTERLARWCRQHHIATKGHPLAWNYSDAPWWPSDPEELRRMQLARIEDCVSRFAGLIDRWDVINEVTHFDRQPFAQKAPKHTGMWRHTGQIELARQCFDHARRANPKALLLVNDYRVDPPYERVIEQLLDAQGKRLYDAVGIQSHMHGGTWSNARIREVCDRFARFGVPLHFTETTILSGRRGFDPPKNEEWVSTPDGEAWQAAEVVRFYIMLFSHPAVEAITWWDFADFQSWKNAPAGFLRRDMSPKPSFDQLRRLVKQRWWTMAKRTTGADGSAAFRGFRGAYKVTVRANAKEPVSRQFVLRPADAGPWVVTIK